MTSLLWRHLYLERSQSVQYFAQHFSFTTHKCWTALWVKRESDQVQQANVFKRQTLMFHFSTYRPNSCKHHTLVRLREGIDRWAFVASVVETTRRPGSSSSTRLQNIKGGNSSCSLQPLLSRRSRQREQLSASVLSICSSVCLSVCRQNAKGDFLKN